MKYEVNMSCGQTVTVDLIGKTADRERKIAYLENQGLCSECYKKMKDEEDRKKGFLFKASVNPVINRNTGDIEITVWFEGDTKPHKDEIKSIGGYVWGEKALPVIPWKAEPFCWSKIISFDRLEEEAAKARAIGANVILPEKGSPAVANYAIAKEEQRIWLKKQKMKKELKNQIVPHVPDIIKGKRWNRKIYGKKGHWSIYLDGEQVKIDDEQAAELEEYLDKYSEYLEKVKELEKVK